MSQRDGGLVRLSDVAAVEDGEEEPRTVARRSGVPSVVLSIRKQSGANTIGVVDAVVGRLAEERGLLPRGYAVEVAFDGQDGLERLRVDRGFQLLVTDINMPRMNGADMLEAAQAEGLTTGLPIVVLTTEGHPDLVARAKAAGARGWMMKPTKPEALITAAAKLTRAA